MVILEIDAIELAHGPGHPAIFKDFSYDFDKAGCYAILGKNGVGKSTLLTAIAGSHAPCTGRIKINGVDLYRNPALAKTKLFYVPDNAIFYPFVTGRAFLNFVLSLYDKTALLNSNNTLDLVTSLGLNAYLDTRFSDASLGTRVKLYLLVAFIIRPALLIMDEPFNGLDSASIACVIHFLSNIKTNARSYSQRITTQ